MNEHQTIRDAVHRNGVALQPGTAAPDFTLKSTPDQSVTLSEFRGNPVILAFYPADWSPVCGDQMALFRSADGFCERALFVLDEEGVIRWTHVSPVGINPGADGILAALEALHPEESKP